MVHMPATPVESTEARRTRAAHQGKGQGSTESTVASTHIPKQWFVCTWPRECVLLAMVLVRARKARPRASYFLECKACNAVNSIETIVVTVRGADTVQFQ